MVDIIGTLNIVDMLESKNDKIKVEKITKSKDEVSETINENEVTSDMTTKEVDSQEKVIEADVSEVIDTDKVSEEAKVLIAEEIVDDKKTTDTETNMTLLYGF